MGIQRGRTITYYRRHGCLYRPFILSQRVAVARFGVLQLPLRLQVRCVPREAFLSFLLEIPQLVASWVRTAYARRGPMRFFLCRVAYWAPEFVLYIRMRMRMRLGLGFWF